MARIRFMNTEIDNLTMDEAVDAIEALVLKKQNAYVVTPNTDHIVQLENNKELREIYTHADLILADGKPLIWISNIYGCPIKEKISGSDIFPRLCERASQKGYTMYFLGAAEGIAAIAAKKLQKRYQSLRIVGTYSPPYGFEKDEAETDKIIKMIHVAKPDILIVGLGAPKQEKFIYRNLNQLNVPVSLGLGASLDFEAGNIQRAPRWMCNHGLEWFWRIIQDPKRLAKRYIIDFINIIPMFFKYYKISMK